MSIQVRHDGRGVATVTIANAAKLNTLNTPIMEALVEAVEALGGNQDLRAVVVRGEGERAFIGGADISEMATLDPERARSFITLVHRSCDCFRRLPVPVIARIPGWTLGAGLELAAACDMRVAGSEARFGMPEVRVGVPSVVEAALLPRLIGWGRTRQLLFTGDAIDAETALRWGLVEEVVAPDALDAAVERMLSGILASGPRAIRLQKSLIQDWEDLTVDVAVQNGIDCFSTAWQTDEPRRMMEGFLEAQRARKSRA
ncbi:MAG: enoyl-CoA hydratase [Rhodospirillales bacterium 69-11]|nr:enoyl-CoA hydratase/isomerase family protein [Rhodospirillales bacterium]MBN8904021.1 enoyl-CoA hydratase/isomerase family protein [Rhodospirillales bacterium]MBN8929749.1 enoyl-CoA hydratase/isomerase family protein [Rhodospirillales bacterium]OJW22752.1 MAG: enoyl-CoA hydratase [Rhodospirillales bacterium 69-11]